MAEAVFNSMVADASDFSASSCGIYADGVSPISENARKALLDIGIEFTHTSRPLTEKLIEEADIIIGISASHARTLINSYDRYKDKIFAFPFDVSDPFGGDLDIYKKCLKQIREGVSVIINTLTDKKDG